MSEAEYDFRGYVYRRVMDAARCGDIHATLIAAEPVRDWSMMRQGNSITVWAEVALGGNATHRISIDDDVAFTANLRQWQKDGDLDE